MVPKQHSPYSDFKYLRYWVRDYGRPGQIDQKGAMDFLIVEPDHVVKALKSDLLALVKGNFDEDVMHQIVGKKRCLKHGDYAGWARLMLLWMVKKV